MNPFPTILDRVREYLSGRVVFALAFGSIVSDHFREDSDVDLAVYLPGMATGFLDGMDLQADLSDFLKRDVDVILLNCSDLIITMQALANGQLIVDNDHRLFVEFKARKISEYIDFKMDRRVIEDQLLRRPSLA